MTVVAAVLGDDPVTVAQTIAALERQVYGPSRVVIVGSGDGVRALADEVDLGLVSGVADVVAGMDAAESHVWFLRAGAEPRPDALQALAVESERVGASVAGSKLLSTTEPDRLLAVGVATDVFDEPYLGLDPDEVDAGQYDVVRDVAAAGGASLLVRRDLARGLGGPDPAMAPGAAAIDFCQRARLRGGRVVVVPSSEVMLPPTDLGFGGWREEAGRIRAMVKAYSWVTLSWALPVRFIIGLVEAVVAPLTGRWPVFRWAGSWLWTLGTSGSILRARQAAQVGRVVGDDELFRYQVRGSTVLRRLGASLGGGLRGRSEADEPLDIAAFGRELRKPELAGGALLAIFVLVATRSLWGSGLPAARFSLPLPSSGWDAAAAYAGGWNPAGLGSTEPLPPFIGLAGVVQSIVFDRPTTAAAVLVGASFLLGVIGFLRLARGWGIDLVPAMAGSVVLIAGPATRAVGDAGAVPTLVGIGILPWAIRIAVAPWPRTWRRRVGRLAGAVFTFSLLAMASPLLPVTAIALVGVGYAAGNVRTWHFGALALGAGAAGVAATAPWLAAADLGAYVRSGDAFWEPGALLAIAFGVAAAGALLAAPGRLGAVAIWGSVATGGAAWLARSQATGAGREVEFAALAAVAMGSAVVTATVFEALRRVDVVKSWDRVVIAVGGVGAAALVASAALVLVPGRAGLPADELSAPVRFIDAGSDEAGTARVLFVGPADTMPGEYRTVRGAAYRVTSAPLPTLDEAWLAAPAPGDDALAAVLDSAITGATFRAGELLTAFGIRWVIALGDTPLEEVLGGQLDLVPLEGLRRPTFVVDDPGQAVRALSSSGDSWVRTPWGYEGAEVPGETVFLAETASSRWEPGPWEQREWGNVVSAAEGRARFDPIPSRRFQAQAVGVAMVLLLGAAWWGRRGA